MANKNEYENKIKELKNKLKSFEHELDVKKRTLSEVMKDRSSGKKVNRRCEDCERYISVIKELESTHKVVHSQGRLNVYKS